MAPSLTASRRTCRVDATPAPLLNQSAFSPQLYGAEFWNFLLQPRTQPSEGVERAPLRLSVDGLDTTSKKYSSSFEDDIERLATAWSSSSSDLSPRTNDTIHLPIFTMARGRGAQAVSRKRVPPKKAPGKGKKKAVEPGNPRKRSAPLQHATSTERPSKIRKIDEDDGAATSAEAVKKTKTGMSMAGPTAKFAANTCVIDLTSSDEDDDIPLSHPLRRRRVEATATAPGAPVVPECMFSGLRSLWSDRSVKSEDPIDGDARSSCTLKDNGCPSPFQGIGGPGDCEPNSITSKDESFISMPELNGPVKKEETDFESKLHEQDVELAAQTRRNQELTEELACSKTEHAAELSRLREEHENAQRRKDKQLDEVSEQLDTSRINLQQQDTEKTAEIATLTDKLAAAKVQTDAVSKLHQQLKTAEAENNRLAAEVSALKKKTGGLKTELDELQEELEAEQEQSEELIAEFDELQALQEEHDDETQALEAQIADLKAALKQEQEETKSLADSLESVSVTSPTPSSVSSEATRPSIEKNPPTHKLMNPLPTQQHAGPKQSSLPFSAASSTIPLLEEERKIDNVRNVYMLTKRKYDTLLAAAANIATATRGMDLSSFGEFGTYLRQLRMVVEQSRGGEQAEG